jgi:monofunctional biosynthetic peptidoglycan transglycosylase
VRRLAFLGLAAAALAAAAFAALWLTLPDPNSVARATPRTTALIEQRRAEARARGRSFRPRRRWVPLSRIAPVAIRAVLASEDARFYAHGAFDWKEVQAATEQSLDRGRALRGASTITQQLAKNLWLGTERTLGRKVKEAVLALKLERALPKRRILALYLNVAEWDDGVFGIEAAARARFGVSAAGLSTAQAALLAAMLPAPRRADLDHPSRWLKRRSRHVLDLLLEGGRIDATEHAHASADLEKYLAGATGPDEDAPDDD